MAIDTSGEWWVGTESADIDPYLRALTEADDSYLVSSYRSIVCECGTDRFRLERAGDVARRECVSCGASRLTCREIEDWDEAIAEAAVEEFQRKSESG